jgi:hypothetical protein
MFRGTATSSTKGTGATESTSARWPNWKGFTWKYDAATRRASLRRANGKEFGGMELLAPGKAEFEKGMRAVKLETGKNTEAEEAGKGR